MARFNIPHAWLTGQIRIALIGCGGTGSEVFDELFRIHSLVAALGGDGLDVVAFDPDTVSPSNIGRQRFWPADIGFNKAEVLVNRVNNFGGTQWSAVNEPFRPDQNNLGHFHLIVTCVDTPRVRAEIGLAAAGMARAYYTRNETLWLDCGNDAHSGNVILGHLFARQEAKLKLPNVFDLYPMLDGMEESNEPSCSTAEALARQDYGINRSVAREAANLIWQLLRHGQIDHHGSFIDIRTGETRPLPIDAMTWDAFKRAS